MSILVCWRRLWLFHFKLFLLLLIFFKLTQICPSRSIRSPSMLVARSDPPPQWANPNIRNLKKTNRSLGGNEGGLSFFFLSFSFLSSLCFLYTFSFPPHSTVWSWWNLKKWREAQGWGQHPLPLSLFLKGRKVGNAQGEDSRECGQESLVSGELFYVVWCSSLPLSSFFGGRYFGARYLCFRYAYLFLSLYRYA